MGAWNGWRHISVHTYGTWLPGDARGWREKHHKRHVPGDYKSPPPVGFGDALLNYSHNVRARAPVHLLRGELPIAGEAIVEGLKHGGIEVVAASVDGVHCHVLGRFQDAGVRKVAGQAKSHASHVLGRGPLWQSGCGIEAVRDRRHQVAVHRYILAHSAKGAWTWTASDDPDGWVNLSQ